MQVKEKVIRCEIDTPIFDAELSILEPLLSHIQMFLLVNCML